MHTLDLLDAHLPRRQLHNQVRELALHLLDRLSASQVVSADRKACQGSASHLFHVRTVLCHDVSRLFALLQLAFVSLDVELRLP